MKTRTANTLAALIILGAVALIIAVSLACGGELDTQRATPMYPFSNERPGSYSNPYVVEDQRGHIKGEMRETYPGSRELETREDRIDRGDDE
jgi:hypothetical protein